MTHDPDPRRWKALALLCAVALMAILDSQIVIVALPSLRRDLGFSEDGAQWVLSAGDGPSAGAALGLLIEDSPAGSAGLGERGWTLVCISDESSPEPRRSGPQRPRVEFCSHSEQ
jgi:hypothetical protein